MSEFCETLKCTVPVNQKFWLHTEYKKIKKIDTSAFLSGSQQKEAAGLGEGD